MLGGRRCRPALDVLVATIVLATTLRLPSVRPSLVAAPTDDFPLPGQSKVLLSGEKVLGKTAGLLQDQKPCPSCITAVPESKQEKKTIDKLRIDAIKVQILSKLGLRERPNINSSAIPRDMVFEALKRAEPSAKESITGSNRRSDQSDSNSYYGRTSEVFMFADDGGRLNGRNVLQFKHIHESPETLKVKKATVWLSFRYKSAVSRQLKSMFHGRRVVMFIYAVKERLMSRFGDKMKSSKGVTIPKHRLRKHLKLLGTRRLRLRHMGWKKMDVTNVVGDWFAKNSSEKLNIFVDCTGCGAIVELKASFGAKGAVETERQQHRRRIRRRKKKPFRPFIVVETEALPNRGLRKRAMECDGSITRCCKQTLYVNFEQLKWDDWIISPRGYFANYCMGSCSHKGLSLDSFINYHSYVMEEYKIHNPFASIKPCCAPRKLSAISLIYFDKEYNIIKTDLRDMSVDECGCT